MPAKVGRAYAGESRCGVQEGGEWHNFSREFPAPRKRFASSKAEVQPSHALPIHKQDPSLKPFPGKNCCQNIFRIAKERLQSYIIRFRLAN